MLEYVPLKDIFESRTPLRPVLKNTVEFRELADSVRRDGLLQPILVRPVGDKYEVVDGGHRYNAVRECRLDPVPCEVRDMTDSEVLLYQLQTQALQIEVKSSDYSKRLQKLLDEGMTLTQLCQKIGKRPHWVRQKLKILKLSPEIVEAIDRGDISMQAAIALGKVPVRLHAGLMQDAINLTAKQFVEKTRALVKEYREAVRTGSLEQRYVVTEPQPYLRSMTELREEVTTFSSAGVHIRLENAKTALDGWKACMKWLLHLDPISLRQAEEKIESAKCERLNALERRKANRKLKNQLLGEPHE
ncbi:MAG: ParB/RepB/Spo0J family partition protein [Desulfurellales bacterium]|nr:MAG: ParB/RepB/Spo0J family partition protein [Desulfurellales bacterium]